MEEDEDDDEARWEDWLELTEAQQDATLDREMAEYGRWIDSLTESQRQARSVRSWLAICVRYRRILKKMPEMTFIRERLRDSQRHLLKIKIWKATGTYPGEA